MKRCDTCGTTFNPTNNRNKFCKPCVAERKKANDRRYKQEAQLLNRKNYLCGCGTIFSPDRNQKRCDACVAKAKLTVGLKKCESKDCTNKVKRNTLRFCPKCRVAKRVAATKKQTGERREHALIIKHGLSTEVPRKETETLPSKFTTRGKIRYAGYRSL